MMIRDATIADAAQACAVLRASISELCVADHDNNSEILTRWLANKTPEHVAAWIRDDNVSLLVAVERDVLVAVGAIKINGEITLNYVAPQARFRGVNAALLAALEANAAARGLHRVTLLSTGTAHRFYLARGYRDVGQPQQMFDTNASYRMEKMLPL